MFQFRLVLQGRIAPAAFAEAADEIVLALPFAGSFRVGAFREAENVLRADAGFAAFAPLRAAAGRAAALSGFAAGPLLATDDPAGSPLLALETAFAAFAGLAGASRSAFPALACLAAFAARAAGLDRNHALGWWSIPGSGGNRRPGNRRIGREGRIGCSRIDGAGERKGVDAQPELGLEGHVVPHTRFKAAVQVACRLSMP